MLAAPIFASASTVLWFSVDPGSAEIESDDGTRSAIGDYTDGEGHQIDSARVVVSGDGALRLYYQQQDGTWTAEGDFMDVMLDEFAAEWVPAEVPADTSGDVMVSLQLGYVNAVGSFIELAVSTQSLSSLTTRGHTSSGGPQSFQSQTPWTPNLFHATPEPSSTALLLVGLSAMLLKRRERRS